MKKLAKKTVSSETSKSKDFDSSQKSEKISEIGMTVITFQTDGSSLFIPLCKESHI